MSLTPLFIIFILNFNGSILYFFFTNEDNGVRMRKYLLQVINFGHFSCPGGVAPAWTVHGRGPT